MTGKKWTPDELNFLRANYLSKTLDEIATSLGRTKGQVKAAASNHKIKGRRDPVTEEQRATIRRLYADTSTDELAKIIGRTAKSVYQIAHKLGLKKSAEYLEKCWSECGHQLQAHGKAHQYPKGHVPENKGLRRPGWSPGRMSETQFKKGNLASNRREIGDERLSKDGYVYVKVADGQKNRNWKQKHWIVWEQHNGPIPEGANVVFKDRDRRNFDISNLEMISDGQLMLRNTLHNYPEPLKSTIHQLAGIKRRLNRYAEKQNTGSAEHPV